MCLSAAQVDEEAAHTTTIAWSTCTRRLSFVSSTALTRWGCSGTCSQHPCCFCCPVSVYLFVQLTPASTGAHSGITVGIFCIGPRTPSLPTCACPPEVRVGPVGVLVHSCLTHIHLSLVPILWSCSRYANPHITLRPTKHVCLCCQGYRRPGPQLACGCTASLG